LILCRHIQAEDNAPHKIILVEQAKRVSEHDVKNTSKSESEKNADGGYNANVRVIDCFAAMEYHYTGGRYVDQPIKFRMLSPETIKPGKKYPLIIWFHGMGESGNDNTRQLSHIQSTMELIAGKNKLDFFMIVTQCPSDNKSWETSISKEGKGDAPITIAEEIFDTVIQEYPIDTNRLSVFGLCSGGNAAWNFVAKHSGRFASMAVCSSSPSGNPQDFQQTAIWAFNNKDDSAPWETIDRFINTINATGGNAYVTFHETGGHDSWTNALLNEKVINWMLLQNLKRYGVPQGVVYYRRTSGNVFCLFGLPVLAILSVLIFSRICRSYRNNE
jgi:predicted peptidase